MGRLVFLDLNLFLQVGTHGSSALVIFTSLGMVIAVSKKRLAHWTGPALSCVMQDSLHLHTTVQIAPLAFLCMHHSINKSLYQHTNVVWV